MHGKQRWVLHQVEVVQLMWWKTLGRLSPKHARDTACGGAGCASNAHVPTQHAYALLTGLGVVDSMVHVPQSISLRQSFRDGNAIYLERQKHFNKSLRNSKR